MKKRLAVIYDDRELPNERIAQVAGKKSYGRIIFRQKTMETRWKENLASRDYVQDFYTVRDTLTLEEALERVSRLPESTVVLWLYSDFAAGNTEKTSLLLEKGQFLNEDLRVVRRRKTAMLFFHNTEAFFAWVKRGKNREGAEGTETVAGDMLVELGDFDEFIRYITSGFDARFFNTLEGDRYLVTKRSSNKEKIRSEYQFYYLLPKEMQYWFVQPFGYGETLDSAYYSMERMHMTDLAIRYVHGAISLEEFEHILDRLFYFLMSRESRMVSEEEYRVQREKLYLTKVRKRLESLKEHPDFARMDLMVRAGTSYGGIDEIFAFYERLYARVQERFRFVPLSVVGHGDLCFSNILYQKNASLLRLIDPKGAQTQEELWMDPWYDVAKLSHSICGCYDFFNSGLYRVEVGKDMRLSLKLDFSNRPYAEKFRAYLEKNQFSYPVVRLYEASLFLSMLPLHMDNVQKVFGFLLNAEAILREVETCLKE